MLKMPEVIEQEKELREVALTVVQRAGLVKIHNQETYNDASSLLLNEVMPFRKRWLAYWEPLREAAYGSYKVILSKINEGDDPLERAERQLKNAIRGWDMEQKKIQEQLQRKAQEEAERREQEERLAAAVLAEQSGATEEQVEQIVSAAAPVVAAPVEPTYQRAAGISKPRDNWKVRVIDIKKLCLAVAKGLISAEYVLPNETALNARARADKSTLSIPGDRKSTRLN